MYLAVDDLLVSNLSGIMHMNIIQGTYATLLGLIVGLLYLRYKSIIAVILLHMNFNLTSTLLSSFVATIDSHMGLVFIIGLLGTGLTAWLLHNQYEPENYFEADETRPLPVEEITFLTQD